MQRFSQRLAAGFALAVLLLRPAPLLASSETWKKVRYEGGTISANVNRFDWNTTVTILDRRVEITFGTRKPIAIPGSEVTRISYGQKAYRRIADMAALSFVLTPMALFGVLHKSRDHLIGIEFKGGLGKQEAILLMVHKEDYRELLLALQVLTGKPVENWP